MKYILAGFHHSEENSRVYGKRRTEYGLKILVERALEAKCDIISIRAVDDDV